MTVRDRVQRTTLAAAAGAAACACLGLSAGSASADRPPPGMMGITASNVRTPALMERVAQGGANMVRLQILWEQVEPTPGDRKWGKVDAIIHRAAESDLNVLALIYRVPGWVARNKARAPIYTQRQRSAYRRFICGGSRPC